jgi:hypothetical protein
VINRKAKIGDMVSVTWDDAVTYGRVEADAADVPLPAFTTFGKVGHIDAKKIIILHEEEGPRLDPITGPRHPCIEPTGLPMGCVTKIVVYRVRR